jgi:hypothetical protein
MDDQAFLTWLLEKRQLSARAASDAVSRCRSAEKMLGKPLDLALQSETQFLKTSARIIQLAIAKAKPSRRTRYPWSQSLYSFHLYAAFRGCRVSKNTWRVQKSNATGPTALKSGYRVSAHECYVRCPNTTAAAVVIPKAQK